MRQRTEADLLAAAERVASRMIASPRWRYYMVNDVVYVLDLEITHRDDCPGLVVTSWGYDRAEWPFPRTWSELVEYKDQASRGTMGGPREVAYRFYTELMRELR